MLNCARGSPPCRPQSPFSQQKGSFPNGRSSPTQPPLQPTPQLRAKSRFLGSGGAMPSCYPTSLPLIEVQKWVSFYSRSDSALATPACLPSPSDRSPGCLNPPLPLIPPLLLPFAPGISPGRGGQVVFGLDNRCAGVL
jgi:hypothetical protein